MRQPDCHSSHGSHGSQLAVGRRSDLRLGIEATEGRAANAVGAMSSADGVVIDIGSKSAPGPAKRAGSNAILWAALLGASGACVGALAWCGTLASRISSLEGARLSTHANAAGQLLYRGSGSWTPLPGGMPLRVSDFAMTVDPTGEYVYLFGGLNKDNEVEAGAWRFDTLLEEWTQLPDMPGGARYRMGAAYVDHGDGHIVVAGGLQADQGTGHADAIIFDVAAGTWSVGPSMAAARQDLCVAAVGKTAYVVGGFSEIYDTLDTVESLTLGGSDALAFATEPSLPEPRGDISCVGKAGKVWATGGYYDSTGAWAKSDSTFQGSLFSLSPGAAQWQQHASSTHPRGDAALVALPGQRLMVLGGETHAREDKNQIPDHRVEIYHIEHDEWEDKVSARGRERLACARGREIARWRSHSTALTPPRSIARARSGNDGARAFPFRCDRRRQWPRLGLRWPPAVQNRLERRLGQPRLRQRECASAPARTHVLRARFARPLRPKVCPQTR